MESDQSNINIIIDNNNREMDTLLKMSQAELAEEVERWFLSTDGPLYFGADLVEDEDEEYQPQFVSKEVQGSRHEYQPTSLAVLEALCNQPVVRLERITHKPRPLQFPPPTIDLPPVTARETRPRAYPSPRPLYPCEATFPPPLCELPPMVYRDRDIRRRETPPAVMRDAEQMARSNMVQIQIPDGPKIVVPFGRRTVRARLGNTRWRVRMDPETGAILHVGQPTRK